jgi:hypothetical protein
MDRILNDIFYDRSHIARPSEMSIPFLLSECIFCVESNPNRNDARIVDSRSTSNYNKGHENFTFHYFAKTKKTCKSRMGSLGVMI